MMTNYSITCDPGQVKNHFIRREFINENTNVKKIRYFLTLTKIRNIFSVQYRLSR